MDWSTLSPMASHPERFSGSVVTTADDDDADAAVGVGSGSELHIASVLLVAETEGVTASFASCLVELTSTAEIAAGDDGDDTCCCDGVSVLRKSRKLSNLSPSLPSAIFCEASLVVSAMVSDCI